MVNYIFKRILLGFFTIFCLITITFFLVRLIPGSPFDAENISPEMLKTLEKNYGLDSPLDQQFILYIQNLLKGDLGVSFKKPGVTVNSIILNYFPLTMKIGIIAFLVALVIGISVGILLSVTKSDFFRGLLLTLTTFGVSIPNFVFAILLMLFFGVSLKWLPVLGLSTPKHYIMPVISLAVYPISEISRLVHASYSEAMNQDFVVMAKSKGLSKRVIMIRHILRNALLPVITIAGPMMAFLVTGSFVVENIFTIPGIGREFVNSINNRDYTVIMGLTIFVGLVIILMNLLSDIICVIVDPRIKLENE